MKALVTGAAGFIGSHLAEALVARGDEVCALDRIEPAIDGAANRAQELTTRPQLPDADVVFHLAGRPGVRSSWSDYGRYVGDNELGTYVVLEHARQCGARVVFASSSSVYGSGRDGEKLPISPYGITKLAVEHLARAYYEAHQVHAIGLRYFTVYGPRQRPDMAFQRFITAGINGQAAEVYGDGEQTRHFSYVADVVRATIAAADAGPGVYDVPGGEPASVLEAIDLIGQLLGSRVRVRHLAEQPGDPREIEPARLQLPGFVPAVELGDGLAAQIAHVLGEPVAMAA